METNLVSPREIRSAHMKLDVESLIGDEKDFDKITEKLFAELKSLKEKKYSICFVSGGMGKADETEEQKIKNRKLLVSDTQNIRKEYGKDGKTLVFSSMDFFAPKVWEAWKGYTPNNGTKDDKMKEICRNLVNLSTDVFFTPSWRNYEGCKDEYETALKSPGIRVHDLDPQKAP